MSKQFSPSKKPGMPCRFCGVQPFHPPSACFWSHRPKLRFCSVPLAVIHRIKRHRANHVNPLESHGLRIFGPQCHKYPPMLFHEHSKTHPRRSKSGAKSGTRFHLKFRSVSPRILVPIDAEVTADSPDARPVSTVQFAAQVHLRITLERENGIFVYSVWR